MQRRAILQVSRRHGVDSCAAGHRAPASSPVPVYVSRRTFRSSRVTSNSSDSSSPADGREGDSTPRPSFSAPKFGSRWGGAPTQKQAGLSSAEIEARNSLLEQQLKEVRQNAQKKPTESTGAGARAWEFMNRQSHPRRNARRDSNASGSHEGRGQANNSPAAGHSENPHWRTNSLPPERRSRHHRSYTPKYSSALKWDCPSCRFSCHGEYMTCPQCKSTRPGMGGPKATEDWTCPTCQNRCFGRYLVCILCETPKPGVDIDSLRKAPDHGPRSPVHSRTGRGMKPSQYVPRESDSPADLDGDVNQAIGHQRAREPDAVDADANKDQPLAGRRTGVQAWNSRRYDRRPDRFGFEQMPSAGERSQASRLKAQDRYQSQELDAYGQVLKPSDKNAGARVDQLTSDAERLRDAEIQKEDEYRERRRQRESVTYQQSQEPSHENNQQRWAERDSRDIQDRKAPGYRENRRQRASDEDDDFDREEHQRRREERQRKKREKAMEREKKKQMIQEPSPLYLPSFISVSNLADVIGVRQGQFVRRMEDMGFEDVAYNHILDAETAGLVAAEFNFEPIFDTPDEDLVAAPEPEDKSALPTRPPVVTIMGHVDHGKTTILDWLRKSSVVASEHGGITQHIGAFSVSMPSGKMITFLDTPGHEAFLDMRRRGADVTDIVVLVIAADDSVKPQTVEAIKHATSSKVPVIVAMSKIDKPGVNGEKVKQDLAVHGINVEDYGGDVQAIGVSGKTGEGMVELEEAIITLSEVLDHRADDAGNVEGWVIEASTKSHGRVATVLVRRGTLRQGDIVVAGTTWTRVRSLRNEAGVAVEEASPGTPVEIDGWREQPTAGTEVLQAPDEQKAKDAVEIRLEKSETEKLGEDTMAMNQQRRAVLEKRRQKEAGIESEEVDQDQSGPKKINFIVKADVGGSAEAVMNSVTAVGNNEVYANVLRSGVGQVAESDIEHAASANGHVISFNMPMDPNMGRMAEKEGVNVLDHNVIYKLIDSVKDILSEHLAPSVSHRVTGEAEISQIFEINAKRKKVAIAGCKVRNGMISTAKNVRVLRDQEIIYDGSLSSLKNVKKDVSEMRKDTECGMSFADWAGFETGDHVQCYEEIHEKRHL